MRPSSPAPPPSTPPLREDASRYSTNDTTNASEMPETPPPTPGCDFQRPNSRNSECSRNSEGSLLPHLKQSSLKVEFRNRSMDEPSDVFDDVQSEKQSFRVESQEAFPDSGMLKSVLLNNGLPDVLRQRPQSLRLRPITVPRPPQ